MFDFTLLRKLRRIQEITLQDVADTTNIFPQNIHKIEKGMREGVTFRTVEKIADAIGYDLVLVRKQIQPSQGTTMTHIEEIKN